MKPVPMSRSDYARLNRAAPRPRDPKQAPRKPPRREEAALSKAVKHLLTARGVWWMRCNVGGMRAGARFVRFGVSGCSDLLALLPGGRACFLELKAARGRQSDSQRAFQSAVEAAGACYLIVRSLDDLIDALAREGVQA